MCCRYFIEHKMYDGLPAFLIAADSRRYTGDIRPSEMAMIIRRGSSGVEAGDLSWGYPSKNQGGLLINARAESLHEKPMFCDDVMNRRCLVPASGFYEWDREKQKAVISVPQAQVIYFAGIYSTRSGTERFVIITREASEDMRRIHDRMPLIVPGERMEEWFSENYRDVLKSEAAHLDVKIENEQLSFLQQDGKMRTGS